ncbi:hypothetical protein [Mycobacteroides chelonae]|uniref:hypothetical protein n=1 Tax=Mycobacteroides chelonae TaxID=1774 RepID=UPI001E2A2B71|nr:hypothetical protein [Mycobacteroides chelonae]
MTDVLNALCRVLDEAGLATTSTLEARVEGNDDKSLISKGCSVRVARRRSLQLPIGCTREAYP